MRECSQCGTENDSTSEFCQGCGTSLRPNPSTNSVGSTDKGFLSRFEESVYFRIARGFAWLILLLALIGFAGSAFWAISSGQTLLGGEAAVTASDVRRAMADRKSGVDQNAGSAAESVKLEPKAMGMLTTEITTIFNLLDTQQQQASGGYERFSAHLSRLAEGRNVNVDERIEALRQLSAVLNEIPQADRLVALAQYVSLQRERESNAQMTRQMAEQQLMFRGGFVALAAALITMVSMVLVLLAIERNTRRG